MVARGDEAILEQIRKQLANDPRCADLLTRPESFYVNFKIAKALKQIGDAHHGRLSH